MVAVPGHIPSRVYQSPDGDIHLNGGKVWDTNEVDITASFGGVSNAVGGAGASYRLARGEVTLDGSNPTPITTGLTTVVAAVACFKTAVALGDDPNALSVDYGGSVAAGELDIHAWKNISGTDPTQVASTNNTMVISWIAIGTALALTFFSPALYQSMLNAVSLVTA